jgi:signal transduction histidine kinase
MSAAASSSVEFLDKSIQTSARNLVDIINFTQQVAAGIQGVFDDDAILERIKRQFEEHPHYNMSILYLSEDGSFLYNKGFTARASLSDKKFLGKMLQTSENSYTIPLAKSPSYRAAALSGETVFRRTKDLMKEIFPVFVAPLIVKLFRYEDECGVITPVKVDGKIIGTFGMTAEGFSTDMLTAVENLGYHISNALETAKRYREIQEREKKLEEAKERAEKADKLKSTFLASMSHELRTPLNAVLGFVDIVLSSGELNEENRHYLELAQSSGNNLLKLISDILDFSKIESNMFTIEKTDFSLEPILQNVDSVAKGLAAKDKKQIKLRNRFPSLENVLVAGDQNRLEQVLINLISNAVKFTESGFVEYGALFEGDRLRFYVRDTGIGIAEEKMKVIFEPFRQAEEKITKKYGGSGLGLAISKKIIELMGGDITVDSEVGGGSTFSVILPYKREKLRETISRDPSSPTLSGRGKILVTDDEKINRLMLKTVLEKEGYTVAEAANGMEAIEQISKDTAISMIFMDMYMPSIDGAEAVRRIRSIEKDMDRPGIPIVGVTAASTVAEKEAMLDAGCNFCLTKPIIREKLRTLLAELT